MKWSICRRCMYNKCDGYWLERGRALAHKTPFVIKECEDFEPKELIITNKEDNDGQFRQDGDV